MAVNGNVLFAAAGADGLQVFDLSAPGKTATLATYGAPGESLYIAGRKLYLTGGADGLQLLEVGPSGTVTFDVQVGDSGFVPHTITINAGDTVKWISAAPGSSAAFKTPRILSAAPELVIEQERFKSPHTFNKPGTFHYDCIPSCPGGMGGTVSVVIPLASSNISITPPSVDFGNVTVGTSSDQIITITNITLASLINTSNNCNSPFPHFSRSVPACQSPFLFTLSPLTTRFP